MIKNKETWMIQQDENIINVNLVVYCFQNDYAKAQVVEWVDVGL